MPKVRLISAGKSKSKSKSKSEMQLCSYLDLNYVDFDMCAKQYVIPYNLILKVDPRIWWGVRAYSVPTVGVLDAQIS